MKLDKIEVYTDKDGKTSRRVIYTAKDDERETKWSIKQTVWCLFILLCIVCLFFVVGMSL